MSTVVIQKRQPAPGKSGKTRYVVHYKDPYSFRTKYYKSFARKMDAEQAANKLRNLIDNGMQEEIRKNKTRRKPIRFFEAAQKTLMDWQEKADRKELSPVTLRDYQVRLDVLNRTFGERLLFELTGQDLLKHQKMLYEAHSAATSNRYVFILKQVFEKGVELGAITTNPAVKLRYYSEKEHERCTFLEPKDLENLVRAARKTRSRFYMPALIYLGAEHGASKQEALSLEWKHIRFNSEGTGIISFYRTKNSRARTEFLMPRTKEALLAWKAHLELMRHRNKIQVKDDRFVFCRLDGMPIQRFDKAWTTVCKLAGLDDFHFHDLRHTFCSNLIMAGADLKEAREMIGHSDLAMTDRYTHLSALHKKSLQEKLSDRYSKAGI